MHWASPKVAASDLHSQRIDAVLHCMRSRDVRSVLDLGCGPGPLLERLAEEPLDQIVAVDISLEALEGLKRKLGESCEHLNFLHASFTERDPRLCGFDAAVLLETVEHIDPSDLSKLERALFAFHRPRTVLMTTPNVECNPMLGVPPSRRRHPGHRFEWPRAKFRAWAIGVAQRNGYKVSFAGIGPAFPQVGAPTQLAEFDLIMECR